MFKALFTVSSDAADWPPTDSSPLIFRFPALNTSSKELNTCVKELDISDSTLNICGGVLNTGGKELNISGDTLNTCVEALNICGRELNTSCKALNTCDREETVCGPLVRFQSHETGGT
ncbi:hypothetical protein FACS189491_02140 [Spirochaetia bacterium]|nr:hypothetical protein FACS189491_02140 [Spirochaetia bacterium]